MNEIFQYILYGAIFFFPFMLLAYYPLRYFTRFNTKITFLLQFFFAIVEITIFLFSFRHFENHYVVLIICIVLFNIGAYMLLYTINLGRILFNLLLLVNVANFTIVFSDFLSLLLFPKFVDFYFHWTSSICVAITEVIFVLPVFFYIKHYSDSMIRNSEYDYIWRVAWLIPMLLSGLGFAFIYSNSILADSDIHLYAKKIAICAVTLACLLLIYSFIAKLIRTQHNVLKLKNDLYHQSIQKMQLSKIETQIQETRVLRHDLRHHIRLMCNYVDMQDYDSLKEYLSQYSDSIQQISQLHYTNNTLINTLLVYYADLCRSSQIAFEATVALPDKLPLQDNEITIISSNLLENAFHACSEMDEQMHRFIRVHATCKSNQFFVLIIDNSYTNQTRKDSQGNFLTTKPDGNGLGIQSVKEIVSKYDGFMKIQTQGTTFCVSISIPLS